MYWFHVSKLVQLGLCMEDISRLAAKLFFNTAIYSDMILDHGSVTAAGCVERGIHMCCSVLKD